MKLALVGLGAGLLLAIGHLLGGREQVARFLASLDGLGHWAAAIFIVGYVIATVLLVPASVLTLGAGAYFGLVWGTIYVSLASTLAASTAFVIGRYLARSWVERQIEGQSKLAAIDAAVEKEGWRIVALTRLSPAFPFTVLNYAYGLTKIPLLPYLAASWIAMLPATFMYVYLGSLAQAPDGRTPGQWLLLGVGLAATIAATILITRSARHALEQKLDRADPPAPD